MLLLNPPNDSKNKMLQNILGVLQCSCQCQILLAKGPKNLFDNYTPPPPTPHQRSRKSPGFGESYTSFHHKHSYRYSVLKTRAEILMAVQTRPMG